VAPSALLEVDLDARAFSAHAAAQGWSDGLPCFPPTEELVGEYLTRVARARDDVVAILPPFEGECTVEKIAVNAAMAGAPPEAMPLLCAAVEALADADFNLAAVNATTASVTPALVVNGEVTSRLGIVSGAGCFGGANPAGAGIGRALRFVIRNVAGQRIGETSASVFGQPARLVGIVVGEWEERSPWAPLAERRGVPGDALTAFGAMGTANVVDTVAEKGEALLELIGKSLAYVGCNNFCTANAYMAGEAAVALNPIWATVIARSFPDIEDVQAKLWECATALITDFPEDYRPPFEALGRVGPDGAVHLVTSPEDLIVFVCGGLGSLHASMMHGFGHNLAVTVPVRD
jgi:hypothetical protein